MNSDTLNDSHFLNTYELKEKYAYILYTHNCEMSKYALSIKGPFMNYVTLEIPIFDLLLVNTPIPPNDNEFYKRPPVY